MNKGGAIFLKHTLSKHTLELNSDEYLKGCQDQCSGTKEETKFRGDGRKCEGLSAKHKITSNRQKLFLSSVSLVYK